MEYWDIYDINRNKTGKIIKRGERMLEGEYHLIVHIWIKNSNNQFLVQQRSENVKNPLIWSTTGGSAISGEDSYTAALREVKEELGINLEEEQGYLFDVDIYEEDNQKYISDTYLYFIDVDEKQLHLQKEEVRQVKYLSIPEIKEMMDKGEFFIYNYLDKLEKAKLK